MDLPSYPSRTRQGALLRVFVQPGARATAIVGEHGGALRIKVMVPAAGGRANRATEALLAGVLGVPRGRVAVTSASAAATSG